MNGMRFVCNLKDAPEVEQAFKDLEEFQNRADAKLKFLKKTAKALDEEKMERWKALFSAAQKAGKLDQSFKYEDYAMTIAGNDTQLFIIPRREMPDGGDMLSMILNKLIT